MLLNLTSPDYAYTAIEAQCGPVVSILSRALRAQFIAKPGMKLVGGDLANIEGRLNAWLANEEWKLKAFRDYDAGRGADLYRVAYAQSFGLPVDRVDDGRDKGPQRQIGKIQELALGYQGSVGAWLRFDPRPKIVTALIMETLSGSEAWLEAADQYDRTPNHRGLSPDEWIAIKVVVNRWRQANSCIMQSWWDLQDAALEAVERPGTKVMVYGGRVAYLVADAFLCCLLPSGKTLAYCRPRLVETRDDYLIDADGEAYSLDEFTQDEIDMRKAAGAIIKEGEPRIQVQFDGMNQKTRKWGPQRLYGGLQCNNIVQGTAREILVNALFNVEARGYPVVLHVHDELVSEVRKELGSPEEYQSLMTMLPPWASGLPIAAKAWEDERYVK